MSLCKHGLSIDFVMGLSLLELQSWVESMVFTITGKRMIDPEVRKSMASKNTAALKRLRSMNKK